MGTRVVMDSVRVVVLTAFVFVTLLGATSDAHRTWDNEATTPDTSDPRTPHYRTTTPDPRTSHYTTTTRKPRCSDEFLCLNDECIRRWLFCDGDNDCGDNSDEIYCNMAGHNFSCPVGTAVPWIACEDRKRCIPSVWKCDGTSDCGDDSDERGCELTQTDAHRTWDNEVTTSATTETLRHYRSTTTELWTSHYRTTTPDPRTSHYTTTIWMPRCSANDEFLCLNDACIRRKWFCDGFNDCGDNSDEIYCNMTRHNLSCPVGKPWIACEDRERCIPSVWKCDGTSDCGDDSDERGCELILRPEVKAITKATKRNLIQYILKTRGTKLSINRWGPHIAKTAMALFLADHNFFSAGNKTGEEITYELSLQLMPIVSLKKKISTHELSLFINALTVACIDPRNFVGINLVDKLRQRVDDSNYTNPFTILTLCNARATMTQDDLLKLQEQYDAHLRPLWTDTQAITIMALACISSHSNLDVDERVLNNMTMEMTRKQQKNGTIDNLKTTALVSQALMATGNYRTEFDLVSAIKFMLEEVSQNHASIHDIYYILPVLNSMSLVNISSNHCATPVKTDFEELCSLREDTKDGIKVQLSVIVGDDMDFVRTWKLRVPANYSFYQVLENMITMEPEYKIQYATSEGKPYVVGLGNFYDDAEDGKFWFIYTQPLPSTAKSKPKLTEESPVDIEVTETEELILWYRSGFWVSRESTSGLVSFQ